MFRVSCGYDTNGKQIVRQKTWTPDKNMTPKQVEKEVNRQAVLFEEECKNGYQSKAIKFEAFAEEWFRSACYYRGVWFQLTGANLS